MALKLFNTLSHSIQEFAPLNPPKVGMYCCGPTVYDFAHIGNWRTFVFGDLVRRYLEFKGFAVTHVMNITDVEDKIIRRVRETKTSLREFTGKYEAAFFEDLKTLNCLPPHQTPRATEHIPEIIALIEKLIQRGVAYKAADGSVYFSIEKYRGCGCTYGQLLKLNFDEMRAGERVASDEYDKESVADFALWKARVPEDGEVFWKSDSLGEGRPGWHIECSAMSMKALGETFDLHLGGEDLKFPHHEDEIAQSEGATGKPFVKHWMHGAHLLVEGKKMSKSLGNFFTLRDLLAKGFTGREIRYLLLTAHYRETFNFTTEGLQGAKSALARIEECLSKLLEFFDDTIGVIDVQPDAKIINQFSSALDDDLNISMAWGVIFGWIRDLNRLMAQEKLSREQAIIAIGTWKILDGVLGFDLRPRSSLRIREERGVVPIGILTSISGEEDAPADIRILLTDRILARKGKDFKRADAIRDELKSKGWVIEDTPKGPKLKKI
jgi:cysteinyl-tRNA synthetase